MSFETEEELTQFLWESPTGKPVSPQDRAAMDYGRVLKFDPNQPRDEDGKWTDKGYSLNDLLEEVDYAESPEVIGQALSRFGAEEVFPGIWSADDHIIEWEAGDTYTWAYTKEDWVRSANPDDYYPGAEEQFNKDFWEYPTTLYHNTQDENAESIDRGGLATENKTRGITNRGVGHAVFTTTEPEEYALGSYGDTQYAIDTTQMRDDGYKPWVEQEPGIRENTLRAALANKIGLDNYIADETWDGTSPWTVILYDHIPPKYLERLTYKQACERVIKEADRMTIVRKYNENQPRYPAGHPKGGQWKPSEGGTDSVTGGVTLSAPFIRARDLAREEVLKWGFRTGNEKYVLVSQDGVRLHSKGGAKSSVSFDSYTNDLLEDPARKITLVHNHPRMSSLSTHDIATTAKPGMYEIEAIGSDGPARVIVRGSYRDLPPVMDAQERRAVNKMFQEVDKYTEPAIRKALQPLVNASALTLSEASSVHTYIKMRAYAEMEIINYAVEDKGGALQAMKDKMAKTAISFDTAVESVVAHTVHGEPWQVWRTLKDAINISRSGGIFKAAKADEDDDIYGPIDPPVIAWSTNKQIREWIEELHSMESFPGKPALLREAQAAMSDRGDYAFILKYDPNQPRHPAGSSEGGRFAKKPSARNLAEEVTQRHILDRRADAFYEYVVQRTGTASRYDLAQQNVSKVIPEGRVVINRTNVDTVYSIIEEGRFKTQFETKKSQGLLDPTHRAEVEEKLFGYSPEGVQPSDTTGQWDFTPDVPHDKRPVYGTLVDDANQSLLGAKSYGRYSFILKETPEVESRVTWTGNDSLSIGGRVNEAYYQPSPMLNPSLMSGFERGFVGSSLDQIDGVIGAQNLLGLKGGYRGAYIEAQVHGGVTVKDIDKLRYPIGRAHALPEELVDTAARRGIVVETVDSRTGEVMQRYNPKRKTFIDVSPGLSTARITSGAVFEKYTYEDAQRDYAELYEEIRKYDADQPRHPAGSSEGGQWSKKPGFLSRVGNALLNFFDDGRLPTSDYYRDELEGKESSVNINSQLLQQHERTLKREANLLGANDDFTAAQINVNRIVRDSEVVVQVTDGRTLDKILAAGRFKTQGEVPEAPGYLDLPYRQYNEKVLFGLSQEVEPQGRPIYGYLSDSSGGSRVAMYGDVRVVLKAQVKERTTFTGNDSLGTDPTKDNDVELVPSSMDFPSMASVLRTELIHNTEPRGSRDRLNKLAAAKNLADLRAMNNSWYYEAQVHGGVKATDIARVESKQPLSRLTTRQLEELGIPYTVIKFDPEQPRYPKGHPKGGQWMDTTGAPNQDTLPGILPKYIAMGDLHASALAQNAYRDTEKDIAMDQVYRQLRYRPDAIYEREDRLFDQLYYENDKWDDSGALSRDWDKTQAHLEDLLRDGDVRILRSRTDTLEAILKDGRMKTQHETRTSKGMMDPSYRAYHEAQMFGIGESDDQYFNDDGTENVTPSFPPEYRPVYGYIQDAYSEGRNNSVTQYGVFQYVLKDEVKHRTTVTGLDSLRSNDNGEPLLLPSPMTKPSVASFVNTEYSGREVRDIFESLSAAGTTFELRQATEGRYIEAQIHGQVRLSDIKKLRLPSLDSRRFIPVPPEVIQGYRDAGILVEFYDGDSP